MGIIRIPCGDVHHRWGTDQEYHVAVCDIVDPRYHHPAGHEVNWVSAGSVAGD